MATPSTNGCCNDRWNPSDQSEPFTATNDSPGQRRQQISKYKTCYQVLRQMVAWLEERGVTPVTMEAIYTTQIRA